MQTLSITLSKLDIVMNQFALVLTTTDSADSAQKIAHALVERRLAACVNLVPGITSVYRWKGTVESAQEYLVLAKINRACFVEVRDAIHELHHYEVPECVLLEIADGSAGYLGWLASNLA
jgi:periplasmic divalent cation tolerance protein